MCLDCIRKKSKLSPQQILHEYIFYIQIRNAGTGDMVNTYLAASASFLPNGRGDGLGW
jgi:hypothetical protein